MDEEIEEIGVDETCREEEPLYDMGSDVAEDDFIEDEDERESDDADEELSDAEEKDSSSSEAKDSSSLPPASAFSTHSDGSDGHEKKRAPQSRVVLNALQVRIQVARPRSDSPLFFFRFRSPPKSLTNLTRHTKEQG